MTAVAAKKDPEVQVKKTREEFIAHAPVKLIDEVILGAFSERSSDIHIEPFEHECRVRIRVDGNLIPLGRYKKEIHEEAVARLKVLSSLRTDVRTTPQDGRFKVTIAGSSVSIRLSIVPSMFGEKCVMRLLPHSVQVHSLEGLGFAEIERKKIESAISASHGMVLVVGPTGSGKTTTLYALLQKVSKPETAVVTLEDPVENSLSGITQIQIHSGGNLTFSTALRAIVRQDPDVIMVGEIRDTVTAELATQAALTGHLVLSTLHTNDAVSALPRLVDMGIEPFLIASTVRAVISQRLVRKNCSKCLIERSLTPSEIDFLRIQNQIFDKTKKIKKGAGCAACKFSGYVGRTTVSEVLVVTEKLREKIMQKSSTDELVRVAIQDGMSLLVSDAVKKVFDGHTTVEEIAFVCK